MEVWELEKRMEELRKKMVELALKLGIGHPDVYELSVELDKLHNEWQKDWQKLKLNKMYLRSEQISHLQEVVKDGYYSVV